MGDLPRKPHPVIVTVGPGISRGQKGNIDMLDLSNRVTKAAALQAFFEKYHPRKQVETVLLAEAIRRVPAQSLTSRLSLPVFRASMKDGIGVSSNRFQNGVPDTGTWIEGWDYCRADTGDDFNDRFDAVVAIEDVEFDPSGRPRFRPGVSVQKGQGVRPAGSTIKVGDPLVTAGNPLRPCDLAALAMGGIIEIPVYRKPVVAFIPTGSELVAPGTPPSRGQNIDCNSIMARQMLIEMGAEPLSFPIVRDNAKEMETALDKALSSADVVILNAGSSKGGEDLAASLLGRKGEIVTHGIAAGPGRPMCLAVIAGKPVINLPGPVPAAYYGLDWCIRAVVNRSLGLPMLERQRVEARLTEDMSGPKPISFLCRLNLEKRGDLFFATPVPFRSASLGAWLNTNAQFVSEIGEEDHRKGDLIAVELLQGMELVPRAEPEACVPVESGEPK